MKEKTTILDNLFSGMVFKVFYLFLGFLSFNGYAYHQPWMKYITLGIAVFGTVNCIYRLIYFKKYWQTPHLWLAVLFLVSGTLTMLINRRYGMLESLQGMVWLTLQIILLYVTETDKSSVKMQREIRILASLFVLLATASSMAGLIMLWQRFGRLVVLSPDEVVMRGFVLGRLWGVFTDPNYGSVTVCISGLINLYFIEKTKKKTIKALNAFFLIVSFLHLVFSDSRTGYVALSLSFAIYSYLSFVRSKVGKEGEKKASVTKLHVVSLLLAVVVAFGSVGTAFLTKKTYNYAVSLQSSSSTVTPGKPRKNLEIKRASEEESTDISNRRLSIWNSGKELFLEAPITGVGFRNIVAAAEDKVPNTYIVNNDFTKFAAFHNMWVDILVSQGLVGLFIFLALTMACFFSVFKAYKKMLNTKNENLLEFGLLVSIVFVCLVSSLFLSDTVYVNTQNSVMFWIVLGFLMNMSFQEKLKASEKKECKA